MKPFTLRDALNAVNGRYFGNEAALDSDIDRVTSDSRTAGTGALFIALKGTRVDGHDFMAGCIRAGAVACLTEREPTPQERPAIQVDSTLRATGALAAWHRARFAIPVIGITGSVGKTTTKEMIAAVLSQRFNTHKTQKNLNNELGVPWTLLRLDDGHQVSVVEMGISDFGEMRRLTHMVRPTIAVFSVIGDAHLEFLGDRDGVMRAKGEIFEGMDENGLAVLNGDDPIQRKCHPNMRRVTYGLGEGCDVRGSDVRNLGEDGMRMTVRHSGGTFEMAIPAFGSHLASAALAAAAVGLELGLTGEEIARGVAQYQTVGDRARVIHAGDMTIVSDCYNANPNSCQAAVDSLMQLEGKRRVCVLGDMLELGPRTEELHHGVGEYAAKAGVDLLIGCGPLSRAIADGAKAAGSDVLYYEDKARLIAALGDILRPGDCVLVKASHSMAFEEIVKRLTGE
jgi:UDP-N-acetylmuramoyl-tripeptide--D-alanyl-D-alanine ligase